MAALATLDRSAEELVQSLEQETGAWLLAYSPSAPAAEPPAFASRLKPARLDERTLTRLRDVEQRTRTLIVAYEPVASG